MSQHLVYGAIAALLALHVIALVRAYRRRGDSGRQRVRKPEVTTAGVECQHCGADNDESYRYCQHCVAELPGQDSVFDTGPQTTERRTL